LSRSAIIASLTLLLAATVGFGVTPSANATGTSVNMVASSANIRCDPPNSDAETDADTATVRDDIGGVLGTQESCDGVVKSGDVYQQEVATLGTSWSNYHPDHVDDPIFWSNGRWTLENEGYTTIDTTYNRHLVWVKLQNNLNGVNVIRVNTHWVACGQCSNWYSEQTATINEVNTLSQQNPYAVIIITGDFNEGSQTNLLGSSINGHTVHYDVDMTPNDTEEIMHLGNPRVSKDATTIVQCQSCSPSGPLYTDHAAVGEGFTLTPVS